MARNNPFDGLAARTAAAEEAIANWRRVVGRIDVQERAQPIPPPARVPDPFDDAGVMGWIRERVNAAPPVAHHINWNIPPVGWAEVGEIRRAIPRAAFDPNFRAAPIERDFREEEGKKYGEDYS